MSIDNIKFMDIEFIIIIMQLSKQEDTFTNIRKYPLFFGYIITNCKRYLKTYLGIRTHTPSL